MTDVTTEVSTETDAPPAVPEPAPPVPFWQRPNVERYFMLCEEQGLPRPNILTE